MKKIDSDALGVLNKALGLTGSGSPITELADGIVDQALDVVPAIRRGRTQAGSEGIYTAIMQNVHPGADVLTTQVDPYEVGATARIAPYPDPMPAQFDIWLLSAAMRRVSGAGSLNGGTLSLQYGSAQQGWGIDDSDVAVVESAPVHLAFWDALGSVGITFGILNGARGPFARLGIRLPRSVNGNLIYRTESSAAATFQCQLQLGVFPTSLGQDGLV